MPYPPPDGWTAPPAVGGCHQAARSGHRCAYPGHGSKESHRPGRNEPGPGPWQVDSPGGRWMPSGRTLWPPGRYIQLLRGRAGKCGEHSRKMDILLYQSVTCNYAAIQSKSCGRLSRSRKILICNAVEKMKRRNMIKTPPHFRTCAHTMAA